jgi:hypothetical protein
MRRVTRLHRTVQGVALALTLLAAAPPSAEARELQPLMLGWEQHFSVTWDATQRQGRSVVEGYVINRSPYRMGRVRLLIDSLDEGGRVVDQRVRWVPGDLGGDSRLYFDVAVTPAARYRVRVFSYDRLDEASLTIP